MRFTWKNVTFLTNIRIIRQYKRVIMEDRKTVKEWRRDWQSAVTRLQRVEARIKDRLKDLCIAHPEVPVATKPDMERTIIKAKSIGGDYVNGLTTPETLAYIEIIEKWLADQHPHQQQKLF